MENVTIDPRTRLNELFTRPETSLGQCLVEREHPKLVRQLREHLEAHCQRFTPRVFDYHDSWGFARATTGWLWQHNPVAYVEAVRQACVLMAHYPEVHVLVSRLGDIEFRMDSYYSDTPALRERYAREVAFTSVLLNTFPLADYEALVAWMGEHEALLEAANPSSFEMEPSFVFKGYYGHLNDEPEALDAWSEKHGVAAWLSLHLTCLKAQAVAVQKALEGAGFAVLLSSPYKGAYELSITGGVRD